MAIYDGNKNLLIKKPYNKILLPIKSLISILQDISSYFFRFMNSSEPEKKFFSFLKDNYLEGKKILDFGSGFGYFSSFFSEKDYIGIEINDQYIKRAKKMHPDYKFINFDYSLKILNEKFDLILIYGVLHHIPDLQTKLIMKNIYKSLKSSGKIYVYEPLPPQSFYSFKSIIFKNLDLGNHIRTKDHLISLIPNVLIKEEVSLLDKTDHIRIVLTK